MVSKKIIGEIIVDKQSKFDSYQLEQDGALENFDSEMFSYWEQELQFLRQELSILLDVYYGFQGESL